MRELAFAGPQPRRRRRSMLLMRVLGIYIAAGAGAIQFLDILVDRAGLTLSDRFFMMAVLLGIVGIPFVGAATALYDAAMAERLPARAQPGAPLPPRVQGRSAAEDRQPEPLGGDAVAVAPPRVDTSQDERPGTALPRRLELALSYRRIAQLHDETGDADAAAAQHSAWLREARAVAAELERLIGDA